MSKSLDDEFFIIDTNNLESIKQKLYGYVLEEEKIILEDEVDTNNINPNGTYIYVKVEDTEIKLLQDFNGSYGLYFYEDGDYFTISNSFLKLVEYLKNKHPITFNKDYADAFLFSSLCSFAYGETLVNEIKVLPRNYKIIINKKDKSIDFEEIDYKEHTIDLDSKEGFEILDNWYYKWVNIIRSIKEKTNNLSIHLSGGFDSRVTAALMLSANIDLDKVNIFSSDDGLHTHTEDYEIASEIAKEFNFELNKDVFSADLEVFDDIKTPLEISFYTKLGFHKEMYFKYFRYSEPVYSINGSGGEYIRKLRSSYRLSSEDFIKTLVNEAKRGYESLTIPTKRVAKRGLDKLSKRYPNISSEELPEVLYREVRGRNHFGKGAVEGYFQNMISLSPAIDSELNKIKLTTSECDDKFLLMATIFSRYCPKLLDFKFDSERKIKEETIEYAKKLNKKYEFKNKDKKFISGPEICNQEKENVKIEGVDKLLRKAFYSDEFEKEFKKNYPKYLYNKIVEIIEETNYYPLKEVYSTIAILRINNYIKSNDSQKYTFDWIKNNFLTEEIDENKILNILSHQQLLKYNTGRIDIKNIGDKNNTIKLIDNSDITSKIIFPSWMKTDEGKGMIIESFNGNIYLKFKCINSGELNITLKSIFIKDKKEELFPIYIDYTSFTINGKEQLKENQLIWFGEPYETKKEVEDGEIIEVNVKWRPFTENSYHKNTRIVKLENNVRSKNHRIKELNNKNKELNNKNKELNNKNKELNNKNKELNNKNKELNNKNKELEKVIEEILSSKSWKLTKPMRNAKNKLTILKNNDDKNKFN